MTAQPTPASSPPAWNVLPFFLLAPIGLVAGGALVADSGADLDVAINRPESLAAVHAIVLGWVSTTILGALYQLGAAVFRANYPGPIVTRLQLALHGTAILILVLAFRDWQRGWMMVGAVALACSFALFLCTEGVAIVRGAGRGLAREYVLVAMGLLVLTAAAGLALAAGLRWGWWTIGDSRVAAHAHLGAVGWTGLMVMGVSYQLVPMFNVVSRTQPRLGRPALGLTATSLLLFAAVMWFGPDRPERMLVSGLLAVGPILWSIDQLRLLRHRARRRLDIQGLATVASLAMLALAVAVGLVVASGALSDGSERTRWLVAYAALGLAGFPGTAVIGNSYKIVPFVVWYRRYRPLAGRERVPTLSDLYSERLARLVLVGFAAGVLAVAGGVLTDAGMLVTLGGALLSVIGVVHVGGLLHTLLPRASSPRLPAWEVKA